MQQVRRLEPGEASGRVQEEQAAHPGQDAQGKADPARPNPARPHGSPGGVHHEVDAPFPFPPGDPNGERRVLPGGHVCFNGAMASIQKYAATGRRDLEPFWPSRQHHDFDRVCRRATNARAL
ncbi:hypothetical protein GCM10010389_04710 [Streptomyces echinoruber]|uniref:Uncharacterized protein n=1 Tax=Streptomyces echinoruber TaxID=68898 RepID=A0A918V533_9ACTN|nr:hypothetical protein GCM10010389_04710 [Streptomyces echinoruber]